MKKKTNPTETNRVTTFPAQHGWFAVFVARDDQEDIWAEPIIAWRVEDLGDVVYSTAIGLPDAHETSQFDEDQLVGYRYWPLLYNQPVNVNRQSQTMRMKYEDMTESDKARIKQMCAEWAKSKKAKS